MKLFSVVVLISIACCISCQSKTNCPGEGGEYSEQSIVLDGKFDSLLAAQVDADEYGMGKYIMAFLKSGPNKSKDSTTAAELQAAHMANINRLADEGKLIVAGPFMDDSEFRGIYVFDVQTIAEAKALTETDPAIQAGTLVMELHPWYGAASLRLQADLYPKTAVQQP